MNTYFLDSDVGIERYMGAPGPIEDIFRNFNISGILRPTFKHLVFNSIKHLYYSNYSTSSGNGEIGNSPLIEYNLDGLPKEGEETNSYLNYEQTTLNPQKNLSSEIGVISIPTRLFGEKIKPGSLSILHIGTSTTLKDDGEGRIYNEADNSYIGNIIYSHGLIILTNDSSLINSLISDIDVHISFSNTHTIYETQYRCVIESDEYNFSQNPTLLSDNRGNILPSILEDDTFTPYITTVGLYNNDKELLMVAKLAKPLKLSNITDTTILINLDI